MFILINQWVMLCLVRTHYIIDLVTGVIFAHYMHAHAERLSFISDALLLRLSGKGRMRKHFKPCEACGWSNYYAGDYCNEHEKIILKTLYQEHKPIISHIKLKHISSSSSNQNYDIEKDNFDYVKKKEQQFKYNIDNTTNSPAIINLQNHDQQHNKKAAKYQKQLDDI
jgi:hypothetical protein